ncbi:hypothetical protein LXL04_014381 [Taraxacum kok-saghyz]
MDGVIEVSKIDTMEQLADIFTKSLGSKQHGWAKLHWAGLEDWAYIKIELDGSDSSWTGRIEDGADGSTFFIGGNHFTNIENEQESPRESALQLE